MILLDDEGEEGGERKSDASSVLSFRESWQINLCQNSLQSRAGVSPSSYDLGRCQQKADERGWGCGVVRR